MRLFLRNNGLSIVLCSLFLLFWVAQALTGHLEYNEDRNDRKLPPLTLLEYLHSSHFWEATGENWESEFLQMGAYVFLTVFLFQKGSSESKDPDQEKETQKGLVQRGNSEKRIRDWRLRLYENSLTLVFICLFFGAVAIHAAGGVQLYNEEQLALGKETTSFFGYLQTTQFWFQSFQNWQSEFLAMAAMVLLSIFLRQRGSPESKPVDAPNSQTGGGD